MCCICGSHSLVIGASMGPYACGEPVIVFSSDGTCGGVAGDSGVVGALDVLTSARVELSL